MTHHVIYFVGMLLSCAIAVLVAIYVATALGVDRLLGILAALLTTAFGVLVAATIAYALWIITGWY